MNPGSEVQYTRGVACCDVPKREVGTETETAMSLNEYGGILGGSDVVASKILESAAEHQRGRRPSTKSESGHQTKYIGKFCERRRMQSQLSLYSRRYR